MVPCWWGFCGRSDLINPQPSMIEFKANSTRSRASQAEFRRAWKWVRLQKGFVRGRFQLAAKILAEEIAPLVSMRRRQYKGITHPLLYGRVKITTLWTRELEELPPFKQKKVQGSLKWCLVRKLDLTRALNRQDKIDPAYNLDIYSQKPSGNQSEQGNDLGED